MFNPIPPQDPEPPRRDAAREPLEPIDEDRFDIRRRDGRDYDDDRYDIRRRDFGDNDLTTVDWLLCIFCSGIACIVGIVRLIQGKPNAGKMIGISLVFVVIWTIVRILLEAAVQQPGFR